MTFLSIAQHFCLYNAGMRFYKTCRKAVTANTGTVRKLSSEVVKVADSREKMWGISDVVQVFIWRLIIVVLLGRVLLHLWPGASQRLAEVLDRLILLSLTLLWVGRKGAWRHLGLKFTRPGRQILYGLLGGAGLLILAGGTQWVMGKFLAADLSTNPLVKAAAGAQSPGQLLWPLLIGGVLVPATEEIYYRGMAYTAFARRWGTVSGILVSAVFFSLAHLSGLWFVQIAVVGAGLAVIYHLTGSLWPGIIAHGLVNSARLLLVYWSS
ncbi:Abortive infection protein [Desulforamulus hydrothermalis Lam5 = DSM 18033]|uniref:Abortive infection protein n=2 Tax=Desulforamulus TaxID=2916693 RepID=K8E0V2_9FIRM|nr:Abortive infection protein [Desulforamulus hydrothermalis Lam5 = DSM 18033]SHH05279.1 hypothetical protein SAMN02745177_01271 [Desulforamulus hydrothermalis Lam5 = DSM 18033]